MKAVMMSMSGEFIAHVGVNLIARGKMKGVICFLNKQCPTLRAFFVVVGALLGGDFVTMALDRRGCGD